MFTGFKILIKQVTLINLLYQVNNHIKQGAKMTQVHLSQTENAISPLSILFNMLVIIRLVYHLSKLCFV